MSPNVFDMAAMCFSWLSSTTAIPFHWPGHSQHILEMGVLVSNVWQGVAVAAPGGSTGLWKTLSYYVQLCSNALITAGCLFRSCWADLRAGLTHRLL